MIVNRTVNDINLNANTTCNIGRKSRILVFVASLIIIIAGAATLTVELLIPSDEGADFFFPAFCFVMGVLLFAFSLGFNAFMKLILKKTMQGKESVNTFTFTEDGYEISSVMNDGTTSQAQGTYAGFTSCREYRGMWLLYINRATVFAVSKSGMTEGTEEELTALLKRSLGERYKGYFKTKKV